MNYLDQFKLKKDKAIILGGLGLIGMETSKAFLDAGAEILILDKNNITKEYTGLKKKFKSKINFIKFDGTSINSEKIFKNCIKRFNLFINCSYPKSKKWDKVGIENLKKNDLIDSIKSHTLTSIWLSILFAKSLKKNSLKGSIINLSSIYGLVSQDIKMYKNTKIKENIAYSFVKSGIINFSRQLSTNFSRYQIRSNVICSGGVLNAKDKKQTKKLINNYSKKVPIGRMAKPQEIASAILFLSSNASSYITGTTLIVDGGWTSI